MTTPTIQITQVDFDKLKELLRDRSRLRPEDKNCIDALSAELDKAQIKPPEKISPDVITLNSRARLWDLEANEYLEMTIVLPERADLSTGCISILAPLGTAMLGYSKGDTFTWNMPGGQSRFRVDEILFQPEASGKAFS